MSGGPGGARRFGSSALRPRVFECGMLPPRTQGYFLLLVQEKVAKEKDPPDGATATRASAVPGPGADLTRHPASKIRRGHPVRAPFRRSEERRGGEEGR